MGPFFLEVHEDAHRISTGEPHGYETYGEALSAAMNRVDDALPNNHVHVLFDIGHAFLAGDGGNDYRSSNVALMLYVLADSIVEASLPEDDEDPQDAATRAKEFRKTLHAARDEFTCSQSTKDILRRLVFTALRCSEALDVTAPKPATQKPTPEELG